MLFHFGDTSAKNTFRSKHNKTFPSIRNKALCFSFQVSDKSKRKDGAACKSSAGEREMPHCSASSMRAREGKQINRLWLRSQALSRSQSLLYKVFMASWTKPRKAKRNLSKNTLWCKNRPPFERWVCAFSAARQTAAPPHFRGQRAQNIFAED